MNKEIPETYELIPGLGLGRSRCSIISASDFLEVWVSMGQTYDKATYIYIQLYTHIER